jgi:hypothetical protein
MKNFGYYTLFVTLLIASLAAAAVEERRMQSFEDVGDIFNGFFGDGFFLCNDGVDEPVAFYIYFLYLIGGIFFGDDETGEFLGKSTGQCDA